MNELVEALQLIGTIIVFGFIIFALISFSQYKSQ